jgi:hypothetical protein
MPGTVGADVVADVGTLAPGTFGVDGAVAPAVLALRCAPEVARSAPMIAIAAIPVMAITRPRRRGMTGTPIGQGAEASGPIAGSDALARTSAVQAVPSQYRHDPPAHGSLYQSGCSPLTNTPLFRRDERAGCTKCDRSTNGITPRRIDRSVRHDLEAGRRRIPPTTLGCRTSSRR